MALTGPDTSLMGIFDRIAYQVSAAMLACTGGTDLWDRVDAADDEDYENRVEGPQLTALDAAFAAMYLGDFNEMTQVLADIQAYANLDLALDSFDGLLTARRCRIALQAAEVWQECVNAGILSVANIGSRADGGASAPGLELGHMIGNGAGAGAFTAGTDMSETTNGPSPIWARVTVKDADDWAMTVTCDHAAGIDPTTEDVIITVAAAAEVGDTYIVGETLQDENNDAGQAVVKVATTDQFAAGQKVLLSQWTGDSPNRVWIAQEIGTIKADGIVGDTSIELTGNLLHNYTIAGGKTFVYPLYIGVSDVDDATGDDGTADDCVYFYPAPDRELLL